MLILVLEAEAVWADECGGERFHTGKRRVFIVDVDEACDDLTAVAVGTALGVRRRQNPELSGWLEKLKPRKWMDCPVGITAAEQATPPRTRVQEVASGEEGKRVFVIDSEERQAYEERMRTRSMEKVRLSLENFDFVSSIEQSFGEID